MQGTGISKTEPGKARVRQEEEIKVGMKKEKRGKKMR
jgi:hypothetical protein